jgi:hypothetical protein
MFYSIYYKWQIMSTKNQKNLDGKLCDEYITDGIVPQLKRVDRQECQ